MKKWISKGLKGISLKHIIIELFVVFCGVSLAFFLSDRAEEYRINKQSQRILRSLKIQLEPMRIFFPDQSQFMQEKVTDWIVEMNNGTWGEYYDWRYLQPQYNYTVLQYAINERETEIIDFELYKELLDLYRNIRQLEEAETYMTEVGMNYHFGVDPESTDPADQQLIRDNTFHFSKFLTFANDRAGSLMRVAEDAENCLEIINSKFSKNEYMDIMVELGQRFVDKSNTEINRETLEGILVKHFDELSAQEREQILSNIRFK